VTRARSVAILLVVLGTAVALWYHRGASSPETRTPSPESRQNVVLITIDTLRADRVGRGLTPAIDAVAARGTSFTTVRTTVPLTLPSHVSMMTGTLPVVHGVRENGVRFDRKTRTIAEHFKEAGYQTGAFVGAYVLNRRFGLDAGFDVYDDEVKRDVEAVERLEAERPGAAVVDAAQRWLQRTTGPLFLWVHLYDPHAPYAPPSEFLERAGGNAYDGEVAYADAQVGRLLQTLDSRGLSSSTVVAVAGDHGEGLGEHGEQTHGMLAYDTTLRVPLVIAVPGAQAHQDAVALSLAELGPRLVNLAGIPAAAERVPIYAETVYPRRAGWHALSVLADERWKLIRSSEVELYEITSDPLETRNVAAANDNVVQAMSAALLKMQQTGKPAAAVAPEAAERLRALGYVSGSGAIRLDDPQAPNPARVVEVWTRFEEALGQLQYGRTAAAAAGLRDLVRRHPEAPVFQSTYARALKESGDPGAAVQVYRSAVAKWPEEPALFHDLAVAAREAGDIEEATRAEQAALALDDTSAMAQNGLGLLHADAGRHAGAAAAFERAAQLDPTNPSYWTNLGNARGALGDGSSAETAYRRALDVDEDYADALNGLGTLNVQAGRFAQAIPLFERALERDPQLHEARLNLGIALHESGQRERAASVYRRLLETAPLSAKKEREAAAALLKQLR
jgi:tetratricopeptide (TPR) repeat protein